MQNLFLSRFRENRKKKVANYFDEIEIIVVEDRRGRDRGYEKERKKRTFVAFKVERRRATDQLSAALSLINKTRLINPSPDFTPSSFSINFP